MRPKLIPSLLAFRKIKSDFNCLSCTAEAFRRATIWDKAHHSTLSNDLHDGAHDYRRRLSNFECWQWLGMKRPREGSMKQQAPA